MWFLGLAAGLVIIILCVALYRARVSSQALSAELKDMGYTLYQMQQRLFSREPHYQDSLTALISWPMFQDRLVQSLNLCARHQMLLGVLYVDLDDFKVINEALSYEVGDLLLKEVSARLQTCIRQVDSISRPNKDTFVVMLNRLSRPEMAAIVAERMLQALANPYLLDDVAVNVSATIGISLYPQDAADAVSLLRCAEQALRMAKSKGKFTYQFYQSHLQAQSVRVLAMTNHLATQEVFNELEVYYQPIMNVASNTMQAMEVSLHWNHPEVGLVLQDELFASADKQRRLNAITDWMMQKACRQFLNWHALKLQPQLLAVPVRLKQFEDTQFIYRLSQLLQQLHFNPSSLLLLVQETGAAVPLAQLEKAFNMLTYLGVRVAMDERLSSHFPLTYLKQFHFHYLRIEKPIIEDVLTNMKTQALVTSMVLLTQQLSMQLMVAGVETEAQKEKLAALGVDCMQGAALGPALTERQLADSLILQ
jgi:diguanylate cyclase (GGDEF)-like protein